MMEKDPWVYPTTEGPRLVGMTRKQCNAYITEAEERGKRAERERIKAMLESEVVVENIVKGTRADVSYADAEEICAFLAATLEETDG